MQIPPAKINFFKAVFNKNIPQNISVSCKIFLLLYKVVILYPKSGRKYVAIIYTL